MKKLLVLSLASKRFEPYLLDLMEEENSLDSEIYLRVSALHIWGSIDDFAYLSSEEDMFWPLLGRSYKDYSAALKERA